MDILFCNVCMPQNIGMKSVVMRYILVANRWATVFDGVTETATVNQMEGLFPLR